MKTFASDNFSGIHPKALRAIEIANKDHAISYGEDPYTRSAAKLFKKHFGKNAEVFFVFNGTAANVLGLKAACSSYNSILCTSYAHINVDECGAPENFLGCKLQIVDSIEGKLTIESIAPFLGEFGNPHHVQPKVVSISQSTELGTVYRPLEIKKIADYAHKNHLLLHMDGARLANAAAFLGSSLKELTSEVGVDFLSFGGTKNGLLCAEAIIFLNSDLAKNFAYLRKQGMQLCSKMRFLSAQFEVLLTGELWLKNAQHANRMALLLGEKIKKFPQICVSRPIEANAVFATLPKEWIVKLQKKSFFYVWDTSISEVRWMTSFDTTENDIQDFVELLETQV